MITGGDTTSPRRVGRQCRGPAGRSDDGRRQVLKYRVQIARFERSHARYRLHPVIGPDAPARLGRGTRLARLGVRAMSGGRRRR